VAIHAAADIFVRDVESIDESGAYRLYVEGRAALGAQLRLQQARRAGENKIGRRCRDDDQVEIGRRNARRCERLQRGLISEVARCLRGFRDVALPDAGTGAYPFVGRVDATGEFVVADYVRRQIAAGADDTRVLQARFSGDSLHITRRFPA